MRLNTQTQTVLQSNTPTVSRGFSIGDESIIIEILRNKLYSTPIQTLVQEYLSNARDAMREAKNTTQRIQVDVPTKDDLTLRIRDFGPGLSPERVEQIFVKYGASTKRVDDTQTGGFGIGAKSAWSYTDSFVVISYHNGLQYNYVVHTATSKNGSLDLISTVPTSDANGVEIQIAVKNTDLLEFHTALQRATAFWQPSEFPEFSGPMQNKRTVNYINETYECEFEQPAAYAAFPEGSVFNRREVQFLATNPYRSTYFLCVDGIPYPCPDEFKDGLFVGNDELRGIILINLTTAEIEVAASREAVTVSPSAQTIVTKRSCELRKSADILILAQLSNHTEFRTYLSTHRQLSAWYSFSKDRVWCMNTGEHFIVEPDGTVVLPDRFNPIICKRYTASLRKKVVHSQISYFQHIKYPMPFHVLYADDEVSHTFQTQRIKAKIAECEPLWVLECTDEHKPLLAELAGLLGLSGTSTLGTAPKRRTVKRETDQDVIINIYNTENSRQTISKQVNLKRNQTSYIYAVRSSEDASNVNATYKDLDTLLKSVDLHLCLVSQSNADRCQHDPKFTSIEIWLKNIDSVVKQYPSIGTAIIDSLLYSIFKKYEICAPASLVKSADRITDPQLNAGLRCLQTLKRSEYCDTNNRPGKYLQSFHDQIIAASSIYAGLQKYCTAMVETLKTSYPLVNDLEDRYSGISDASQPDLVFYCNAKYASLKGVKP